MGKEGLCLPPFLQMLDHKHTVSLSGAGTGPAVGVMKVGGGLCVNQNSHSYRGEVCGPVTHSDECQWDGCDELITPKVIWTTRAAVGLNHRLNRKLILTECLVSTTRGHCRITFNSTKWAFWFDNICFSTNHWGIQNILCRRKKSNGQL